MADSIADSIANHLAVWSIYLGTGRPIAGRPESLGEWMTADLYQACLIFHR